MPTLEDATRCPRCGNAGLQTGTHPIDRGAKVISYQCDNPLCLWYSTGWIVQINADGTIPEYKPGPKQFAALTPAQETSARDYLRQAAVEAGRNPDEVV